MTLAQEDRRWAEIRAEFQHGTTATVRKPGGLWLHATQPVTMITEQDSRE